MSQVLVSDDKPGRGWRLRSTLIDRTCEEKENDARGEAHSSNWFPLNLWDFSLRNKWPSILAFIFRSSLVWIEWWQLEHDVNAIRLSPPRQSLVLGSFQKCSLDNSQTHEQMLLDHQSSNIFLSRIWMTQVDMFLGRIFESSAVLHASFEGKLFYCATATEIFNQSNQRCPRWDPTSSHHTNSRQFDSVINFRTFLPVPYHR